MANITIYLPDLIEKKARKAAKARHQPLSRWIADRVRSSVESGWSPDFLDAAGSLPDFPPADSLRSGYGPDAPREEF
jgi:hypothetical protein